MEGLPTEICLKVFGCLDHQNLTAAQLVCRKWRDLASDDTLWSNLFKERWGIDRATFHSPVNSKSWKDAYVVQDRCDRIGLGLKIIREGDEYFLIHQGEIQKHLGSRRSESQPINSDNYGIGNLGIDSIEEKEPPLGILDKILFFIGDLEAASVQAKRNKFM